MQSFETITITRQHVVAILPKVRRLPPQVLAKLQADMAHRIEEMAYAAMTGGRAPEREQSMLDVRKYRELFPNGNKPRRYGIVDLDAVVT